MKPRSSHSSRLLSLVFLLTASCAAVPAARAQGAAEASVYLGAEGRLHYKGTSRGDHIADFSYAGYRGGGVPLPHVPALQTLAPSGEDDTSAVQAALDALAKKTSATHPGALQLAAGRFHLKSTLYLRGSGVVLRGSGRDDNGTTLELTGSPHMAVMALPASGPITGDEDDTKEMSSKPAAVGGATTLTDAYVPSGARVFHVVNAAGLHTGSTVLLVRPVTPGWLAFMGMDKLSRGGKPETWVHGELSVERIVAAVEGNTVAVTVPLTDSFDPAFGGGIATRVFAIAPPQRLQEVGVEDLRIVCPALHIPLDHPHFDGVSFRGVEDGWMRNLDLMELTNAIGVGADSRRLTIENITYVQHIPIESSAKPFVFSIAGTQVLVQRVSGTADSTFYYATQARMQGPNVLRDCVFHGNGHVQPHQRWSTGLLIENCSVPNGGIDLQSRGEMGSGHGWPIGWSVAWNNRAGSFVIQSPPGTLNWSIGNIGSEETAPMPVFDGRAKGPALPQGRIESPSKPVVPASLYDEQLRERLQPAPPPQSSTH